MPDSGAELFVPPVTKSHTSTPQWQSFEVRMRHRRAERCVARADLAFSSGVIEEAQAALAEARALAPDMPALLELEQRMNAPPAPPIEFDDLVIDMSSGAAAEAVDLPAVSVDRAKTNRRGGYARAAGLAASVTLVVAAFLAWPSLSRLSSRSNATEVSLSSGAAPVDAPPEADAKDESPERPAPDSSAAAAEQPLEAPARTATEAEDRQARTAAELAPTPTSGVTERPSSGVTEMPARRDPAPDASPARELAARTTTQPPALAARSTAPPPPAATAPAHDLRASLPNVVNLPASGAGSGATRESLPLPRPPTVDAVPLATAALTATNSVPVSAPEAAAEPRPRPIESATAVDPRTAVRAALTRYEAAFSGLNVAAARAVWPGVDERALSRAFDGLSAQRISLDRCDVTVAGATARASCSGFAEWTPKVGGGQRRQNRKWSFDLAGSGGAWQIVRADAR